MERKSETRGKKERARHFHTHICLFVDITKTNVQVQEDKEVPRHQELQHVASSCDAITIDYKDRIS